jgi:hypothetical protein
MKPLIRRRAPAWLSKYYFTCPWPETTNRVTRPSTQAFSLPALPFLPLPEAPGWILAIISSLVIR